MNRLKTWIGYGLGLSIATVIVMGSIYAAITIFTEVTAEIQGWMATKPDEVHDVTALLLVSALVVLTITLFVMISVSMEERRKRREKDAMRVAQENRRVYEAQESMTEWMTKAKTWQLEAEKWQREAAQWKVLAETWQIRNTQKATPDAILPDLGEITRDVQEKIFGGTPDTGRYSYEK